MAHTKTWRSLGDFTGRGANVAVECLHCKKVTVFDAVLLARYCMVRRWNPAVEALYSRFFCRRCKRRPHHIGPSRDEGLKTNAFPVNEEQWKALEERLSKRWRFRS